MLDKEEPLFKAYASMLDNSLSSIIICDKNKGGAYLGMILKSTILAIVESKRYDLVLFYTS